MIPKYYLDNNTFKVTNMDNLRNIMRSLDDISNLIPEGTYLEMCDNLKMVHDQIPNTDDPPVRDNRQPGSVEILFANWNNENIESEPATGDAVPEHHGALTLQAVRGWYNEMDRNEDIIDQLMDDMKIVERSLKNLKPIKRITKRVREDAIKRVCKWQYQAGLRETLDGLNEWTFENYIRTGPDLNMRYTDSEVKWYTSKGYEQEIYTEYKRDKNQHIEVKRSEVLELKRNLEHEITEYRNHQSVLREMGVAYNL